MMKLKAKRLFQHVSKGSGSLGEVFGAKRQKALADDDLSDEEDG